jgi:hypothetical protein
MMAEHQPQRGAQGGMALDAQERLRWQAAFRRPFAC